MVAIVADDKIDSSKPVFKKNDVESLTQFIINKYDREKLENIFHNYGELRNYRRIVDTILSERKNKIVGFTLSQDRAVIISEIGTTSLNGLHNL